MFRSNLHQSTIKMPYYVFLNQMFYYVVVSVYVYKGSSQLETILLTVIVKKKHNARAYSFSHCFWSHIIFHAYSFSDMNASIIS